MFFLIKLVNGMEVESMKALPVWLGQSGWG